MKRTILLVAIAIIGLAFAALHSDAYHECTGSGRSIFLVDKESADAVSIGSDIRTYTNCAWFSVERNADPILAIFTIVLAVVTVMLWWTTHMAATSQSEATKNALRLADASAQAARETADATILASAPMLFPRVVQQRNKLLPVNELALGATHTPSICFVFENYGKSPAIVREYRCALKWIEGGNPTIDQLDLTGVDPKISGDIIPGPWVYGDSGRIEATELRGDPLDSVACDLLRQRAGYKGIRFARFFFFGSVKYDDLFGYTTTQHFCLKVTQTGWQAVRGPIESTNHVRTRINKSESARDASTGPN